MKNNATIPMQANDCLFPIAEAEALVSGFTNCTLTKSDWTHEAHLIAGLYLLARYGEDALPEMRLRLLRFNESVGGINDDHNGYHETLTVFWLWLIQKSCADERGIVHWNQTTLDEMIDNPGLADRNIWQSHYSSEVVKSVAARRGFVPPDLGPME